MEISHQSHTISLKRLDEVPCPEDLAFLALQHRQLKVQVATRLRSPGINSQDAPTLFFNALQEALRPLLPSDYVIRTGSQLRRYLPKEPSDNGALASWSYITIFHTWTEEQALQIAPLVAAAARDYDALATRLMIRLAYELDDSPEAFASDDGHWCQYKQSGRLDDWGYFFHGVHCCFGNKDEWRIVEAAQGCENATGYGFGELDSGFFAHFCHIMPAYKRLRLPGPGHLPRVFEILATHGYVRKVSLHQGYNIGFVANHDS